jgi:hypothetical protein
MFQVGDEVQFLDILGNLEKDIIPDFNNNFEGHRNGYVTFLENKAHVVKIYNFNSKTYYACSYTDSRSGEVILGFEAKFLKLLKRRVSSSFNVGDIVEFITKKEGSNYAPYHSVPDIYKSNIRESLASKGCADFKENKGKVIGFDENGVIVEFTDTSNRIVPLTFKEERLRLINKSNTNVTDKAEQNRTEQISSTGIEVQRPHPSITTATRGRAVPVSGRASRTAVTVGHLSNKAVSF